MTTAHHSTQDLRGRRLRASAALNGIDAIVLVSAGEPLSIPGGQDQTYPFIPHPDYRWLTGRTRPGSVIAWDSRDGPEGWIEFVPPVETAEQVWEGARPLEEPGIEPIGACAAWLARRSGRSVATLGAASRVAGDPELSRIAGEALLHARRPKDASERALLLRAVESTAAGFAAVRPLVRPGVTERAIQIELEAAFFRAGAEGVGYGTIVGSGPNSGILHGAPSARRIGEGELVLIDAGAAIGGYTADVTRTMTSTKACAAETSELHAVVLRAERRAIERCRVGAAWREVHTAAARDLAEGLISMGILRGSIDAAIERESIALFFPHGIGHMVGLGVRDAGGRLPGAPAGGSCCGVRLRVDLPLAEGYLMTIEPGLYFIPAILRDPARRERLADAVHWPLVDTLLEREIGGVRIEDNVLVTSAGPQSLTRAIDHAP